MLFFSALNSYADSQDAPIIDQIINIRLENQLSELREDPILTQTARKYALTLVTEGSLRHRDDSGHGAAYRVQQEGGDYWTVGEILGAGPTVDQILHGWMKSASHRKVILTSKWTRIGWGIAPYEQGYVMVILFA